MVREKPRPPRKNGNPNTAPPSRPAEAAGGTEYAFGKNSIEALLTHAPERVFKIMVADDLVKQDRRLQSLVHQARDHGKNVQTVPKAKLDQLTEPDERHQGILAMVAPKPLLDVYDLIAKIEALPPDKPALVLALDEVTDPRNFGALIRVAAGAGATALMIPKMGSAGFSPLVGKASAGTLEFMDIVVVTNLVDAMERLKKAGLWWVGAALDDQAVSYEKYDFKGPTGILLGSEGAGLRRLVKQHCDQLVKIPLAPGVESLNVTVAGGILLFEALRQRGFNL